MIELPNGTVVGEAALKDGLRRNASVVAHSNVDTLALDRDKYIDAYNIAKKKELHIYNEFINSVSFIKNLMEYKKNLIVNMLAR